MTMSWNSLIFFSIYISVNVLHDTAVLIFTFTNIILYIWNSALTKPYHEPTVGAFGHARFKKKNNNCVLTLIGY